MGAQLSRSWMMWAAAGAWTIGLPAWLLWPDRVEIARAPQQRVSALRERPAPALDAALTRPLLALDRRPPQPEDAAIVADAEQAVAPQPPQLVGTIAGRVGSVALLRSASGETARVHVGDTIDGWRVTGIANRMVALDQNGRRETLRLDFEPAREPAPEIPSLAPPGNAPPDAASPTSASDTSLSPRAPNRP